jgi:solute carrier family 45 protein 1/2/4
MSRLLNLCCRSCVEISFGQILIAISMSVTLLLADEKKLDKADVEAASGRGCCSAFGDLFKSLKNLPPAMFKVLAVTAVTWVRIIYLLHVHVVHASSST